MRKLAVSVTLTPLFLLALFSVTNAQTSSSLQAELNALLAQLAALQSQLQTTTGSSSGIPTAGGGSAYGSCPNIVRTLKQGMSGSDVTALQAFLAADSRIYPEGTISGYFGLLTQYAVQRFQSRHGLVTSGTPDSTGYGLVGPGTRNLITSVCRSGGTPTPQNPTTGGGCVAGGVLVASGATANFYSVQYVPAGSSCDSYRQTRQCINGTLSGSPSYQYASCGVGASSVPGSCTYNGTVMMNGESRTFYRKESPVFGEQCQSTVRTCSNGIVTGSTDYAYPSCTVATSPASCTLNGVTVAHGQSRTFYKREDVLFGQSCSAFAGTRSCDNGTLSGDSDYRYANCSAAGAKSCTVVTTVGTTTSTTTVAHGTSRNFWSDDSVPYTTSCEAHQLARTCNDGVLSGSASYKYPKCTVVAEKGCDIDGIMVAGGATRTFYTARVNANCANIDQQRKCTNGVLSGTASYQYAYCAPSGQRYCVLDGAYVKHGESKAFYTTENPAFGSSCSQFDQMRKCTDGTLDGSASYSHASCTEPTGRSCTLDGKTVSHNQKHTFYSRSTSSNCAQYGQERTCIDGTLSGSADFSRSSCTTASIEGTSQVAAALAAMEELLKDALAKLGSWF